MRFNNSRAIVKQNNNTTSKQRKSLMHPLYATLPLRMSRVRKTKISK